MPAPKHTQQHHPAAPCTGTSMPVPMRCATLTAAPSSSTAQCTSIPQSANTTLRAAPSCSGVHRSSSSTLKQHPAAVPCRGTPTPKRGQHLESRATCKAAPFSGSSTFTQLAAAFLQWCQHAPTRAHHFDSSTLKQHLAAAPRSGTSMPAPKRIHL